MTIIDIKNDTISVKGHSGYDVSGKDIVCAAISTLVESTYNYLEITGNKVDCIQDDGEFIIKLLELNNSGKQLINGFSGMIDDLISQYPEYIGKRK